MKKIDVKQCCELLKNNDNFLIFTHRNPDGDTLGCGFGLLHALLKLGKNARVKCCDEIPSKYSYMFPDAQQDFEPSYIIAVDVADLKLIGDDLAKSYAGKINLCIDHHISNKEYADNLLLRECSAASEIIYDVVKELGVTVDAKIASCLYTGISTDTGCFLFSNVTPYTHIIAADLIEKGADYVEINKVMFETKSRGYFKLEELALNTIETMFDGRCAVMLITQKMLNDSGTTESDCDGIAGIPRKIDGVLVGVTIRERTDGSVKVSLRSHAPVDSSKICCALGGGGHARAAGCELDPDNLERDKQKLLSIIKTELDNI